MVQRQAADTQSEMDRSRFKGVTARQRGGSHGSGQALPGLSTTGLGQGEMENFSAVSPAGPKLLSLS